MYENRGAGKSQGVPTWEVKCSEDIAWLGRSRLRLGSGSWFESLLRATVFITTTLTKFIKDKVQETEHKKVYYQ